MIDFSKVFFSIFWANRKLPLCWCESHTLFHLFATLALFSITYPTVSILPSLFILHSSFFILHSSFFTTYPSSFAWLHSSFFTLHSSLFTLHSKKLSHTAFQANFQKFLGFYGKFHRELVKYFLPKTIHDE